VAFDPNSSILAGMDDAVVRANLVQAQAAYLALSSGQQVATATYGQGDGTKSVTFRQTDLAALVQSIKLMQQQLGIPGTGRRAFRPYF
jgi:hypothetical protein